MNKTLNIPYLVRILAIAAVVVGGVYLLHRRQAGKQAAAFLYQAAAAGDYTAAEAAEAAFAEAVARRPDLIPAYGRRAGLLRQRLDQPEKADTVIESMLKANGRSAAAHLMAAAYWKEFGNAAAYSD